MNRNTLGILTRATELVIQGHAQGAHALNRMGDPVPTLSPDACYWCASGALYKAAIETDGVITSAFTEAVEAVQDAAFLATGKMTYLADFNDSATTSQVLDAMESATLDLSAVAV